MKSKTIFLVTILMLMVAGIAHADSITYSTPSGSTTSGPVDASANFTTSAGTLTITLTNLQANITDVAQALSDLDFTLSNQATTGTISSSSGQEITVASGGTYTLGSTVSTGWGLNNNVSGGLQLDALGYVGPAHLIIGPPDGSNLYSNANGSIAGNKPHNPFLNQSATFVLLIPGVTVDTTVTSATFSFGTTAGIDVVGVPTSTTPEPSSLLLFGSGCLAVAGALRRKLMA